MERHLEMESSSTVNKIPESQRTHCKNDIEDVRQFNIGEDILCSTMFTVDPRVLRSHLWGNYSGLYSECSASRLDGDWGYPNWDLSRYSSVSWDECEVSTFLQTRGASFQIRSWSLNDIINKWPRKMIALLNIFHSDIDLTSFVSFSLFFTIHQQRKIF
jgi:hypothetical protein